MSAIEAALKQNRALYNMAYDFARTKKIAGLDLTPADSGSFLGTPLQGATETKYALYRGWVYSAVNAIAMEAAGQPARVGQMARDGRGPKKTKRTKTNFYKSFMTPNILEKAAEEELEIFQTHDLNKVLNHPNSIQHKWQFTYSFVANLVLTGWAFVVGDLNEDDQLEYYSIPSTWIRPDHKDGPFSKFYIINPNNPKSQTQPLDRRQVSFAHIPNPGDPLGALSPTTAQLAAVKIDDQIQESQFHFFKNGIFPSVIITMGATPHPDVPSMGIRPRLTPVQRRQVYAAIKKVSSGIANYGNPAIIDGMIEKIERLSATQNEMGWEKSEMTVRDRILSALGVHPFILGKEMAGSYAQSYIVQERFLSRVNTYLDMLSVLMTEFVKPHYDNDKLLIWWDKCKPSDPSMEKSTWENARLRDDVTQNEFRAWMGLSPDEDGNESVVPKQSIQAIAALMAQVGAGAITPESATALLEGLGIPSPLAKKIAGKPRKQNMIGGPGAPPFGITPQHGQVSRGEQPRKPGERKPGLVPPTVYNQPGPAMPVESTPKKEIWDLVDKAIEDLKQPIS